MSNPRFPPDRAFLDYSVLDESFVAEAEDDYDLVQAIVAGKCGMSEDARTNDHDLLSSDPAAWRKRGAWLALRDDIGPQSTTKTVPNHAGQYRDKLRPPRAVIVQSRSPPAEPAEDEEQLLLSLHDLADRISREARHALNGERIQPPASNPSLFDPHMGLCSGWAPLDDATRNTPETSRPKNSDRPWNDPI